MARKKRKKRVKRHSKKVGRVRKVLVKRSGSMTTLTGKRITWKRISPHAKFFHEKVIDYRRFIK